MRITNGMMLNSMMRNISRNQAKMDKTQQNLSTGKKFLNPSDDPIGVSRSLRLNTDVANMDQYKRNVEDGQSWLKTTEQALDNIGEVLKRTKELTVQAANETNSIQERNAIASEIESLKGQLINLGNANYAGSYIFSGYKTDKPVFDSNGKYIFKNNNDPAALVMTLNSTEKIEFNIGVGDRIGINFTAQRVFGTTAGGKTINDPVDSSSAVQTGQSSQLIEVYTQLITDLKADNTAGINGALSRIETHLSNVNAVRAEVGVKTNRLELTSNRIDDDTLNLKDLLSKNEDVDMSEVIMNLQMQENVYKASLSGGAKIIQPSLLDFLR